MIPTGLLDDLAQLVKANSIEGNKKDNQQIIYTPWSNIKKTGDLAVGTVTFHNERKVSGHAHRTLTVSSWALMNAGWETTLAGQVRRHFVKTRENAIVNRLNKTRREEKVDHESVRIERQKERERAKREVGNELVSKRSVVPSPLPPFY